MTVQRFVLVNGDRDTIRAATYDQHELHIFPTTATDRVDALVTITADTDARADYLARYQRDRFASFLGLVAVAYRTLPTDLGSNTRSEVCPKCGLASRGLDACRKCGTAFRRSQDSQTAFSRFGDPENVLP